MNENEFFKSLIILNEILLVPKEKYNPSIKKWKIDDQLVSQYETSKDKIVIFKRSLYNEKKYKNNIKKHEEMLGQNEEMLRQNEEILKQNEDFYKIMMNFVEKETLAKDKEKYKVALNNKDRALETNINEINEITEKYHAYLADAASFISQFPEFDDNSYITVSNEKLLTTTQYINIVKILLLNILSDASKIIIMKETNKWDYTEMEGYEEFVVPMKYKEFVEPTKNISLSFQSKISIDENKNILYQRFIKRIKLLNILILYVENTNKIVNLIFNDEKMNLISPNFTDKIKEYYHNLNTYKYETYKKDKPKPKPTSWYEYIFGTTECSTECSIKDNFLTREFYYCKKEMDLFFAINKIKNDYKKCTIDCMNEEGIFDFTKYLFLNAYEYDNSLKEEKIKLH